ncbi:MAG TPA: hydratase [Chloroflexia bacterium]|nr:hydratase [Chloroflexia bacterium]
MDVQALAQEFLEVRGRGGSLIPPSTRFEDWNLAAGYAVGHELAKLRQKSGWVSAGRKIGFTNKTIWPSLGMDTVIWAYIYEQTIHYAHNNEAELSLARTYSTLIEPEIVFKLKAPLTASDSDPVTILEKVEWLALGYEVVDCNFPAWKFIPSDAVADFGLHFGLIIGEPQPIRDPSRLAEELGSFQIKLFKDGQEAARGKGSDVLEASPAAGLHWLARTLEEQGAPPLAAGEIITTGTLTPAPEVKPGQAWNTTVEGIELPGLFLRFT